MIAEAAGHTAELEVLIVRHRASGWVSEIARKDEDAVIEAHFDPESGIVTVYEGRPEFKALERAARRAGLKPARVRRVPAPAGLSDHGRSPRIWRVIDGRRTVFCVSRVAIVHMR